MARFEVMGATNNPVDNRSMMEWLHLCPLPDSVHLRIAGERVPVRRLFQGRDPRLSIQSIDKVQPIK